MQIGYAKKLDAHEDGSEDWLEARRQGIGGSDAATVLGMSPFGVDREILWKRKRGEAPPFRGNAATEYGTRLEPYLRERLADERPHDAIDGEIIHPEHSYSHPKHEWMRANIDGVVSMGGPDSKDSEMDRLLEIKTSSQSPPDSGAVDYHYAQIQHYLEVFGLGECVYAYFEIPADREFTLESAEHFIADTDSYWRWVAYQCEPTIRVIKADESYQQRLVDAERDFWACVESGERPGEYRGPGEVELEDDELKQALADYARAKATLGLVEGTDAYQDSKSKKERAKERAKTLLSSVDAEKVYLGDGDSATYTARGYWRLYPAERESDLGDDDESDTFENVPF